MSEKLRMGLIGLGVIGGLHARIMAESPNIELVAVADLNEELAKEFAKKYACEAYMDYKEMIAREDIDAVSICVPEEYHKATAVTVAEAKKDILIEKPLAMTYSEAKDIHEAAEKNSVRMMVAHVCQFDPRYAQLRESIKKGELGEITSMTFMRGNPVSTANRLNGKVSFFYYLGVHDLEMMMNYNLPAKPTKVYAIASNKKNGHMNDYDTAHVLINFDNGAVGNFQVGWAYPNHSAMGILSEAEVTGTKGAGKITIENQGIRIMTEESVTYPDALYWPEYNGKIQGDLPAEINHFAEATYKKEEYLVQVTSALYAVAVAEAALKSIKSGQPIELEL